MSSLPLAMRLVQSCARVFSLGCCALLGCDFPISSSKYSTAPPEANAGTADDSHPTAAEGLDPSEQRLVRAFAGEGEQCARAFREACSVPLSDCAASSACVDYGTCMRERADPTAETTCSDAGQTSIEDSWKFELLRHCWASRYAECPIGKNFECVGRYGPPSGERSASEVRQQILVRGTESAPSNFSISFCAEWTDCATPILEVAADRATGVYDATLPVGGKNFGAGNEWRGYRLVRGEAIPDSIVLANIPIWGRRVEITRLLSAAQASALSIWYSMEVESSVFVQVVDCNSDPAPGVSFELPTSPTATAVYVDDDGLAVAGATVATGAAGISGYDPAEPLTIHAVRGGELVAIWSGELSAGMPRYLRLHPLGTR